MNLQRIVTGFLIASICLVLLPVARAADVKIDSSIRYQTMDGFGTCTYIYSNALEMYQTRAFQDLYMNDLGASLMRMEISPDCQTKPDLDLDHLNLDKLDMTVRSVRLNGTAFAAMQKRYPGKLRIFASLWTPPGWMKDSGVPAGGGHLRPDRIQHLGKYIAAFCIDFEKTYGVHIYAVSLQNELAFSEFYNSCIYTPDTFRDTIKAVKEQMNKWGCTTLLMGPEDVGAGSDFQVQREMGYIHAAELDPAADKALDLFNVHGYADDKTSASGGTTSSWAKLRDATQGYNKRLWQTETSGDHPKWPGPLHVALDIHEAVAYGNCSAWAYWQIIDPGKPDDFALLGSLDPSAKKYCAAKHYFKYIRPGAVRVSTVGDTASFFASAFVDDQDKTLTIVLLNMGKTAEPVHITLPDYPLVQHMQAWRTSADESFAAQPDVASNAGAANLTMPPQSIVTLYGIGTGDAPTGPTVPTNLLAQPLNEAVDLTWTAGWHADSYVIERAAAGSGAYHPIASGVTGTHFVDTGLTDGQQYTYVVKSTNAQGSSPNSASAIATPMAVEAAFTANYLELNDRIGPEWDAAKWYSLDHVVRGSAPTPGAAASRFKVMWGDGDDLYLLMETSTPAITAVAGKPFDTDGWEIYIDAIGARPPAYGRDDYHFVLPFGATAIQEVAHGSSLAGSCISFKTPTGYCIKAVIPLSGMIAACNGEVFGIDFNVADHKVSPPIFKRAWWSTSDFDWQNPAAFGAIRLSGAPGKPPADSPTISATPGNSSVLLKWMPVADCGGYRILRGREGAPMATIANIVPRDFQPCGYEDLGVDEQYTWQYAVVPYNFAGPGKQSQPVSAKPLTESAPLGSVMIHCGGPAIGRFAADDYFTGGNVTANYLGPINRQVTDPAPAAVYQTERNGKFSYAIPGLTPGKPYLVRLHFCENYWTAPGQRVFSVLLNGNEVLHDFDIFKEARGAHTAVIRESKITTPDDGKLNITFTVKTNMALIQAIEVIPQ